MDFSRPVSRETSIARLNLDSGNFRRVEESLRQADEVIATSGPLVGEKEELWGMLHDALGNTNEAKQHYEYSAQAQPPRPVAFRRLAEIYAHDQSWPEAAAWMERYIATGPAGPARFWASVGTYRLAGKQPEEGVKALQTALELDPYTYSARYQLARGFEQGNDAENAIREYEFLLKYAFDRDPDVYVKLANLYIAAGRRADAERVLAKGMRILPTNSGIYRLYREVRGGG
jgi:tetratricopeptide (TPR) repeat protein